jgi:putative transposase
MVRSYLEKFRSLFAQPQANLRVMRQGDRAECFIHELPMVLTGREEHELAASFEAGRQAYNALLSESLRRLDLMRETKAYRRARVLPRGKARTRSLRELRARFGVRKFDLFHWSIAHVNQTWLAQHLDAQAVRALAERAVSSVEAYAFGKHGRPRFKGYNAIDSLEGQSAEQGIRYQDGTVLWNGKRFPRHRRYAVHLERDVHTQHALSCPIKRVRIVRRRLRSRTRYYVQLICVGRPYLDPDLELGTGIVGLDPGPRVFGIVSDSVATQVDLVAPLRKSAAQVRRAQRALVRSRRATNPERFTEDGQFKRGTHGRWVRSKAYERHRSRLAEEHRKAAATRKNAHGRLVSALLRLGEAIYVERNSMLAFQRSFGRSVASAAPGMFLEHLARKAANAGAQVIEIPTSLRLSQSCHGCGVIKKKPLSLRVHLCPCGVGPVQRDIYAAWLATTARCEPRGSNWTLDADQARKSWSGARSRLPTASSPISIEVFCTLVAQTAKGSVRIARPQGSERFVGTAHTRRGEVRDDVAPVEGARARKSHAGRAPTGAALVA